VLWICEQWMSRAAMLAARPWAALKATRRARPRRR